MTAFHLDTTLAEIVTLHPSLSRQLEHRQLDYCCHGQRSLRSACEEKGLDPAIVLSELAATTETTSKPPTTAFPKVEQLEARFSSVA